MEYVESRNGALYVAGRRVSLASIIHCFECGDSAETIQSNFPVLTLAQVNGAINWYLDHPEEWAADREHLEACWRELEKRAKPIIEDRAAFERWCRDQQR